MRSASVLCLFLPFPACHHLSVPLPFSLLLIFPPLFRPPLLTPPSPLPCSQLYFQHQRTPVAPAGWLLASHFLSCSPSIQQWRAPSGLSRPQGVHQKPPLGSPTLPAHLSEPSEWSTIVLAVIWWLHSTERQSQGLAPLNLAGCADFLKKKHINGSRKEFSTVSCIKAATQRERNGVQRLIILPI